MDQDVSIPPVRDDGLQVQEHRKLQRRFWRLQRVAWAGFGAVCLVAALGFTGSGGPFSTQVAQLGGVRVEAPRVTRWEASDRVVIRLSDGTSSFNIGEAFFDSFSIERIQPEPVSVRPWENGQTWIFEEGAPAPQEVTVDIRAVHPGIARFDIAGEGAVHTVTTLILP